MTEGQNSTAAPPSVYPLGRYLVLAELGRGGMAEVFLALSRGPNGFSKLVVLKLLRTHLAEDPDFLRMFLDEARLAARLNHGNIVQTYEIGVEGGRHAIVMEYLEGRSFAEVEAAAREAPMPLNLGVRVIADTLAGLHYAHELADVDGRPLGLVHRDVSPHNVLITYDGQVKLLDFGIAKAADDGARTKTGVFKGKLRYTAPERFAGEESDRRSDLFSVGVMLWQILTGRRLWAGLNELGVMQQLATRAAVPAARSIRPDVPERLDEICARALAPSPADRFETAAEMQDALEEFLAGESVGATNRALAKHMGEVFGETRQRFQRTVDEQIRAAAALPQDIEMTPSVARLRAEAVPHLGGDFGESLSSMPAPLSSSHSRAGMAVEVSSRPPGLAASIAAADPKQRRGAGLALLAFVALAAVFVVGLLRVNRAPRGPLPQSAAAAVAQVPPAVALAPPPPAIVATVATTSAASPPPDGSPAKRPGTPPGIATAPAAGAAAPRAPATASHGHAPTPAAADPRGAASAAPKVDPPPKHEVDCSSPYYIDDQGMKKIRTECL